MHIGLLPWQLVDQKLGEPPLCGKHTLLLMPAGCQHMLIIRMRDDLADPGQRQTQFSEPPNAACLWQLCQRIPSVAAMRIDARGQQYSQFLIL
nr:hypothetical protein [Nocardia asiatica]